MSNAVRKESQELPTISLDEVRRIVENRSTVQTNEIVDAIRAIAFEAGMWFSSSETNWAKTYWLLLEEELRTRLPA